MGAPAGERICVSVADAMRAWHMNPADYFAASGEAAGEAAEAVRDARRATDPSVVSVAEVAAIVHGLESLRLALLAVAVPAPEEAEEPHEGFDTWACAEIMGHRVRYGYVKTVKRGYRDFVEIRIPSVEAPPEGTWKGLSTEERVEFYAPSALFAVLPMTEAEVVEALRGQERPFL